eukprot:TRINITY_DN556_c0_g2_i13.p1 TRINITY_DN556_c0_g2~~TRINITY_DN556_c0_g2_i13.p1  ORF type:complete len:109 (-),score=14.67 TRINITY_DN556_c0_g2_i13:97-423(-)
MKLAIVLCLVFFGMMHSNTITDDDVDTLCAMVQSLSGLPPEWTCEDRNLVKETACGLPWSGLKCLWFMGNRTATITAIHLSGLSGVLPDEMGDLKGLISLCVDFALRC